MKWAVYVIRPAKDSEVGEDIFVGHLAYENRNLGKSLKRTLRTHKQIAEERGRGNRRTEPCFKLHRRMVEIGPENWKIVPLVGGVRSSDEVRVLESDAFKLLGGDLNGWV